MDLTYDYDPYYCSSFFFESLVRQYFDVENANAMSRYRA
jgi:hypothetical protein